MRQSSAKMNCKTINNHLNFNVSFEFFPYMSPEIHGKLHGSMWAVSICAEKKEHIKDSPQNVMAFKADWISRCQTDL